MASLRYILMVATIGLVHSKPIMVSFGTNQGPIVPAQPISSTVAPNAPKTPAPVYETVDDVPNPYPYKPLSPHQYRNKIYSYKPHPNLILGTPIDQKYQYNPSLEKHNYYKKQKLAKALGFEYRGPNLFDKQAYEVEREKQKALQYKLKDEKEQHVAQKRYDQSASATHYNDGPTPNQYQYNDGPKTNQYNQESRSNYQPTPMRTQTGYSQQGNQIPQYVPINSQVPIQNNYQYTTQPSTNQNDGYQRPSSNSYQVQENQNNQQRSPRYTKTSTQISSTENYGNYQYNQQYDNQNVKYVPQIGIAYSSGLKYYVPQMVYYQDGENSVYQNENQRYYD